MPNLKTILDIGAVLVVLAGIIGGFYAGVNRKRSSDTENTTETIELKDKTIATFRVEIDELRRKVADQEKRINDLEEINSQYVKLFQGNPSQLETYMKKTADSMEHLATAMTTVLSLVQSHPSSTNVTIQK